MQERPEELQEQVLVTRAQTGLQPLIDERAILLQLGVVLVHLENRSEDETILERVRRLVADAFDVCLPGCPLLVIRESPLRESDQLLFDSVEEAGNRPCGRKSSWNERSRAQY